jgi:tetratricopeptide (TPR) repeat protein
MKPLVCFLVVLFSSAGVGFSAAQSKEPEAISLLGQPLYRMNLPPEQKAILDGNLAEAKANYEKDPANEDNIIWYGRRLAYLWRYKEAIEIYSQGLERHQDSYKLLRHRGHRYITVRELDKAIADLEEASRLIEGASDEVEPDGAPNAAGKPRSTSHSNIWYHLGLAYYLNGEFEKALSSYRECLKFSKVNDDMLVAAADWLYMTLRRLGKESEASTILELIKPEMDILENSAYHRRLLMYKGEVEPTELLDPANLNEMNLLTQGYGVANWYYVNGEKEKAKALLEKILESSYWAAFGYIAAEADLRRWPKD